MSLAILQRITERDPFYWTVGAILMIGMVSPHHRFELCLSNLILLHPEIIQANTMYRFLISVAYAPVASHLEATALHQHHRLYGALSLLKRHYPSFPDGEAVVRP